MSYGFEVASVTHLTNFVLRLDGRLAFLKYIASETLKAVTGGPWLVLFFLAKIRLCTIRKSH